MSPPVARPLPCFIADSPQEGRPYGRWAERLTEEFAKACERHTAEAGAPLDPETIRWFPERGWGGRVFVPVTGRAAEPSGGGESEEGQASGPVLVEYFGHVSFARPDEGEPGEPRASAAFTDVTAEDNPQWKIDLSDDVIGAWRAEGERGGEITLVWGLPLVRGAVAATAELDGEVLDQAPVQDGRFTLLAVDAVRGFGDDLYMEVRLWDRTLRQIAAESLYDEAE
ncbi:MAG: hypothetical protein E6G48_03075 [Actinobacteria bacterium]|nr:MAG: hypothetical protein E6G48_03075 [Actinomycetota bacterium]